MRNLAIALSLIMACSTVIPGFAAEEKKAATKAKMTRESAYNTCRAENPNSRRGVEITSCVERKMSGQ